ncbi:MAG: hypothetical protein ACI8XO_004670 [Verrucomicrobiales bacterium]|jgi:hypothetical protein
MPLRYSIFLAAILALPHFVWSQEEGVYPIQLHRPAVKGEAYTYAAVGRLFERIVVTIDGETAETKNESYRCELASKVEVLEVDELGLPTQLNLTVYRFQKQADDEALALDLLGRGAEILCKFSLEGAEFSVAGKKLSGEVAEALSVVAMKLSSQFGETEDQVLGTKEPKAEGDTWALNTDSLSRALARNGFHIGAEKLRSEGQLTSVTKHEGGEAEFLQVDVSIIGEGVSPELPLGYAPKSGTLTNTISRRYPTDPKLPCAGEEISFEIVAEAEGKEAESIVNLKIHVKQTLKARYSRIGA